MTGPPQTLASWRTWCGLGAMTLALFMMTTDLTVMFVAQPTIAAAFQPSATQALWYVHIGEFLAASLVITMGRLGDRVGRRRLLMIGITVYGTASVLAAMAPTTEVLICARALMGIGAATVTPCAMALLRTMFTDSRQFAFAFATLIMASSAGGALGPLLGGVLLGHFWWGSIFLINVPAAVLLLVIAPWGLAEFRDAERVGLDPLSIGLSVAAVMGVVYGLQQAANSGLSAFHMVVAGLGIMCGWLFIRRQRRLAHPLLDLNLLAPRHVRIMLVTLVLVMFAFGGPQVLIGPYLQLAAGLSAGETGMALFVPAAIAIPITYAAPLLQRTLGVVGGTVLSFSVTVAGFATAIAALRAGDSTTHLVIFIGGLSVASAVVAAMTLLSEQLVTSAPLQRTGSMTALQDLSSGIGGATGIAVLGTQGALIFRATLAAPAELSDAELDTARESPGAAATIAAALEPSAQAEFLAVISQSMNLGLQAALLTAIAVTIAAAALVLAGLRGARQAEGSSPPR